MKNLRKKTLEGEIVRWALPNEEIPFHVKINKTVQYDNIIVKLPDDFFLIDTMNVKEYLYKNQVITIHSIKTIKNMKEDYFGLVISYRKIPTKISYCEHICIELVENNVLIDKIELECRIFRPYLKLIDYPKKILLSDKTTQAKLPVKLEYTGFGDITLNIIAKIGGNIVSEGDSLFYEVILRFYENNIKRRANSEKENSIDSTISIEPTFVKDVINKMMNLIYNQKIPENILSMEEIEDLQAYLDSMEGKEDFSEIIFGEINTLLLGLLRDILEKNIEDNIQLENTRTKIKTKINTPIEKIDMKIEYKDLLNNNYSGEQFIIEVDDKLTSHKNTLIEMPIKIEKVVNKPLLNVKDMYLEVCT